MNKILLSILIFVYSNACFSQNLKIQSSAVTFKIKHVLGATADGSFKGFVGTIIFDPENLGTASLKATVDTKTIDTDNNIRDEKMRSAEYFDVEKYPKISMASTKIEKTADPTQYVGTFNITMKNVTKSVKVPLNVAKIGNQMIFKANFVISRIEYGVGGKSSMLNDKATLNIIVKTQL
jgi:polyisoprenoid-binding protein YceI